MKKEQLSQAINDINLRYLEEADNFTVKKRQGIFRNMKWLAVAACIMLVIFAGKPMLNYATGVNDSVNSYFKGETEPYMEEILSHVTSVSNEELELRVEGLIADEHLCYMIVSFIGLTEEMEERLLQGDLEEQELFETAVVLADGESTSDISSGSNTHISLNSVGKRTAVSMIPDAHATYIITYSLPDKNFSEIQAVQFAFEGLSLEVDVNEYLTPMYGLEAENGEGKLSDAYISSLGYGFTYHLDEAISEEDYENMGFHCDVNLIRADGTVMTSEEMAEQKGRTQTGGYSIGDTETYIEGCWEEGHMPEIINLEDYCGLQVNGVNYYFVEKQD